MRQKLLIGAFLRLLLPCNACLRASRLLAGSAIDRQSLNAQQSEMCKLESCCLFKRYLSLRAIFLAVVDLVYLYSSNACVFAMTNDDDD